MALIARLIVDSLEPRQVTGLDGLGPYRPR
jgi:hypothetical protein